MARVIGVNNMNTKLLIIEDKPEELIYAQVEAAKVGYRHIAHATTLDQALPMIPTADKIITDLFFSTEEFKEQYVAEFLPLYQIFKEERFKDEKGSEVVRRAIFAWAELFGKNTVEEGLDMFEKHTHNYDPQGNPNSILKAARDAVHGKKDFDKYQAFLKIEESIKTGKELPLGIIVAREAKTYDISTVIVTSTYHHDNAFEAVRSEITVPYVDTLVDGRKGWVRGLEMLLEMRNQ